MSAARTYDVLELLSPRVRHLREWETIPSELDAGFEQLGALDRNWIWVVEEAGDIKGVLVAAPCHGTAFIWRISIKDSDNTALLNLFRGFLGDMRKRGIKGLITILDPKIESPGRLKATMERIGGKKFGDYELVVAPMPKGFV